MPLMKRQQYLNKLLSFQDSEMIKVITGIRRCGKSSMLKLMIDELKRQGKSENQILSINFESMEFSSMTPQELHDYVLKRRVNNKMYLFFDEVQVIEGWQKAINSFRIDFDCDIYITGSNAYLLSSELSTYLSGRYVEIKMYPLSFREFVEMNNYTILKSEHEKNRLAMDVKGGIVSLTTIFDLYVKFGGMPLVSGLDFSQEKITSILEGVYSAVVIRDILERGRRTGQSTITDPLLLKKIIMFLSDSIGSSISASNISNALVNSGVVEGHNRKTNPATKTILIYIESLLESYIFYAIKRYDIRGKQYLQTLGKYYIVDTGLRNYILGFREGDRGHLLENIVYFELLRSGYEVAVGKVDDKEVDFIATKTDVKKYIQVTQSIQQLDTRNREVDPLMKIRDNYDKIILCLDNEPAGTIDGIKVVNLLDFLLEE